MNEKDREGEILAMGTPQEGTPPDGNPSLERLVADLQNLRRRHARDVELAVRREVESLLHDWLMVLDGLERGVAQADASSPDSLRDGLNAVLHQAREVLVRNEVRRMDVLGRAFDPTYHEAVGTTEQGAEGEVVEEVQAGYLLGDAVLRPARVMVGCRRGDA